MATGRIPINGTAAIQSTTLTTTGDMIYASAANTPARLGIGSSGQVLTVASGIPSWAAVASGGMTLLSTTTISGVSTSVTGISGAYTNLVISIENVVLSGTDTSINATLNSTQDQVSSYLQNRIAWDNQFNDDFRLTANAAMDVSVPNKMANVMMISNYTSSNPKPFQTFGSYTGADTTIDANFQVGSVLITSAITSFQIFTVNGTSTMSGTIKIYGVK